MAEMASEILIRVVAFARLRELLGEEIELSVRDHMTLAELWTQLCRRNPAIDALASTTRVARNGRVVALLDEMLADGDEIALLPPVGGG